MGLKYLLIIFVFLLSFFSVTESAFAAKTPRCRDDKPTTAPVITQAIPGNGNIKLVWTEGQDPITHYLLEYGLSNDQMMYGAQNIGPKGTTSYTIDHLTNGTRYYFRVDAVNNCRLKPSHTVSAVPGSGSTIFSGTNVNNITLSFYKPANELSQDKHGPRGAMPPKEVASVKILQCANNCYGWQFLIFEVVSLFVFFFIAYRYTKIKPIYSLSIPLTLAGLYYLINKGCVSKAFFCHYFYILDLAFFIIIFTLQRQRLFHKALKEITI